MTDAEQRRVDSAESVIERGDQRGVPLDAPGSGQTSGVDSPGVESREFGDAQTYVGGRVGGLHVGTAVLVDPQPPCAFGEAQNVFHLHHYIERSTVRARLQRGGDVEYS